ncbi:glycosyltransferase family 39 protein [Ottowia testudinis]|uniref:Glycosyltransferase family 39 protein n=2 Tax=Ottowia testudinis TaxID=2816950 RepID=A0A975H4V2_9BURK|nr:glycosyltransferase family 39 protein [Ottowia testudinis]
MLVFGMVWLWLLAATSRVAPVDNLEQLAWVRSIEWGYYKHPPLPTWLLAPLQAVFGPSEWLTYVLGAGVTLLSLSLFWGLLRSMRGSAYATVALLAVLCITFYNGRLYYYNHNVVMLLCSVLVVALLWRLTLRPSLWGWAGIGLLMGLGMLAKYQIVIAGTCVGLWWLHMRWWRHPTHRAGAVLAVGIASAVFWPHLQWLWANDWMPLRYADSTSIGVHMHWSRRPLHALVWVADWLLNRSLPAWILLALAFWWAARQRVPAAVAAADGSDRARWSRQFLLLWGSVPTLFMVTMALVGGVDLQKHWGTAFILWSVPMVMEWLAARGRRVSLEVVRTAWPIFALVQMVLLLQYWAASPHGLPGYKVRQWHHFPAGKLARTVAPEARKALGGPIDIISGPHDVAQAIAIRLPEKPRVLISGELKYSPWIQASELKTARVIEVFPARELPPDGRWAFLGWAWRPGVSELSDLSVSDWRRMRQRPDLVDWKLPRKSGAPPS